MTYYIRCMVIAFLCDKNFSHVIPIVNIVSMLHMKCERKYSHNYYIHSLDYIKGMNSLPVILDYRYSIASILQCDTIFHSKIFSAEQNCTFVVALLHMRFIFRQGNKILFYCYLEHRLCCAKYR